MAKSTRKGKGKRRGGYLYPVTVLIVALAILAAGLIGLANAEYWLPATSTDVNGTLGKDGKSWRLGYINGICMEGATSNTYETCVYATDPTADNGILWPNSSGTVMLQSGYGLVLTGTDGQMLIYNALSSSFNAKSVSGDITITNSGVSSIGAEKVTTAKILNGVDGQVLVSTDASSGSVAWVTPSGDVTITNAGVATIGADKVTATKLFMNSVDVYVQSGNTWGNSTVSNGSVMTGYAPIANVYTLGNATDVLSVFANTVMISETLAIVCTTGAAAYPQQYRVFYIEP